MQENIVKGRMLEQLMLAFCLIIGTGLAVSCDLNSVGNTVFAANVTCEGGMGNSTGNITINDGVRVEFRGAQMLFTGTNHTIHVMGSVVFNRTTVNKASSGITQFVRVLTASMDSPMRIYKSYFNATRAIGMTKDYSVVDGAYFNQATRSQASTSFGLYNNRTADNIFIRNVTFDKGYAVPSMMFARNITITGMTIIGDADDLKASGIAAGIYFYTVNRTYVSNVRLQNAMAVGTLPSTYKNFTEFGRIENVSGSVRGITGYTNFLYVLPMYIGSVGYPSNSIPAAKNYYYRNFNVSRNMSHTPSSNIVALATYYDGPIKNFTFEDMAFYDMYYSSSGMKMPYLLRTNATKTAAGGDEFVLINVTAYNSTTGKLNIPYFTVQTATVRTRFANYWYFQPRVTDTGNASLAGAVITLSSLRLGNKSFVTQANGVPYGTGDSLFLGVRVNGTTVTRFRYNITVEKAGYATGSWNGTLLNNSNWDGLELALQALPGPGKLSDLIPASVKAILAFAASVVILLVSYIMFTKAGEMGAMEFAVSAGIMLLMMVSLLAVFLGVLF
jgi:hypothetical protein